MENQGFPRISIEKDGMKYLKKRNMKKLKLKILKIIQDTSHKIGEWAWRKRIILMHEKE